MIKTVGGRPDVAELFFQGVCVAILIWCFIRPGNIDDQLLAIAVFVLLVWFHKRTKTVKAQMVEIVDELGNTQACLGFTGVGLSVAVRKGGMNTGAFAPGTLFERGSWVQFTLGANGSTLTERDRTAFVSVYDTDHPGQEIGGETIYPLDGAPRLKVRASKSDRATH